eukprot:2690461-Pyramimonas_sp.AAC.1
MVGGDGRPGRTALLSGTVSQQRVHPHTVHRASFEEKRCRHKLLELRVDFLDRRLGPPGGASGAAAAALRAPGKG